MYVSRWTTSSPERAGITNGMEDKQPALSRSLIGAAFHTDTYRSKVSFNNRSQIIFIFNCVPILVN